MSEFRFSDEAPVRVTLPKLPYPGLRPFEKHEWPIFFGRELIVDEVVGRLLQHHVVSVHGSSGSGKSSLIRAGVLPRLEQEHASSGMTWRTCAMTPGNDPLGNLARALGELARSGSSLDSGLALRRLLNRGRSAGVPVTDWLDGGSDNLTCILVDQFEELFQFAKTNEDQATLFADFLIGVADARPQGLFVILTMRSDYLGACTRVQGFAEMVNATQYLLPRMSRDDLLRAIREPATLYGGQVTRALAERLMADAAGSQDELPLIQHALMRLWVERSTGRKANAPLHAGPGSTSEDRSGASNLGLEDYEDRGGLAGLLSDHADAVAKEAQVDCIRSQTEHAVVESIFRALTEINAERQAIRRPQTLAHLIEIAGAGEETVRCVIDRFRADGVSFLRPYGSAPIALEHPVDISHEALIRCWRRLSNPADGWLVREFRDGLVWRSLLVQAESFERERSHVLSPATTEERSQWMRQLNPAWAQRYGGGWKRVGALLGESEKERSRAERRKVLGRAGLVAILLLVVAVGFGSLALMEAREAERQFEAVERARALAERRAAEAEAAQKEATIARVHAEQLASNAQELLSALNHVVEVVGKYATSDSVVRSVGNASAELKTQLENFKTAAEQPPQTVSKPEVRFVPRVYFHIADESQRAAARALERTLETLSIGSDKIVVPGIELVKTPTSRNVLRCFRKEECKSDGRRLVEEINRLLAEPEVSLEDLSERYGKATNIRPRHYELWLTRGEVRTR